MSNKKQTTIRNIRAFTASYLNSKSGIIALSKHKPLALAFKKALDK